MKKFFEDTETRKVQLLPVELRGHSDGRRGAEVPDKEAGFVMMWFGQNEDGCSYQVLFNTHMSMENNFWNIFLFDKDGDFVHTYSRLSKTAYPPVWNREFGGVDYFDYCDVMNNLNTIMVDNGHKPFPVDYSSEGKFVHYAKEKPEEIEEILKNGGSYGVLAIKAEEVLKKVEKV